jgi:hypothetical protein
VGIEITVRNGGGTASGTADLSDRLRTDLGLQLGNRAYNGESSQSTLYIDDDDGEYGNEEDLPMGLTMLSIAAHNVVRITETATSPDTVLVRGRVIPKEIGRGDKWQDRSRQVTVRLDDYNSDLKGLTLLTSLSRGAETDVARVTYIFDNWLSGSPRLTTDLTNGIVAGNTVTMPAKVYDAGTPILDIISDCAVSAEKTFFVMADGTFYYAVYDDDSQVASMRISDDPDEINVGESSSPGSASVRLYPSSSQSGTGTGESAAAPDLDGSDASVGWGSVIAGYDYKYMYDAPNGTGSGSAGSFAATDTGAPGKVGVVGYVHIIDGDLLSLIQNGGVIRGQHRWHSRTGIGVDESTQFNYTDFCARVYRPGTSSFVATLVDVGDATGTLRFPQQPEPVNRSFGSVAITPYPAAVEGDYLVIDVGLSHESPLTGAAGATLYNTDTAATDLPLDDATGTELNSWWQLGPSEEALPTYPPIWTGPASTEDGQGLLSGGVLRYGGSSFVAETRSSVADDYDYWVEPIHDEGAIGTADAATRLGNILDIRQFERRTYQVAVQFHNTEVNLVKAGDLIDIKAKAIPDADDQYRTRRVASLEWQWIGPEHWIGVMELDKPLNVKGAGPGTGSGQAALATRPKNAAQMPYDNDASGLTGDTVQEAIDELADGSGITSTVVDHGTMGASEDFDFTDGTDHEGILDQNLTVTLSGATDGEAAWMTLKLTQDGTGTNTINLPASVVNGADVEAAFDTTASAVNIISVFSYDGGTTWYAFLAGSSGSVSAADLVALGVVGPILVADDHSTPLVFADLLQTEAGDDLLYSDIGE